MGQQHCKIRMTKKRDLTLPQQMSNRDNMPKFSFQTQIFTVPYLDSACVKHALKCVQISLASIGPADLEKASVLKVLRKYCAFLKFFHSNFSQRVKQQRPWMYNPILLLHLIILLNKLLHVYSQ